MQMFTLFLANVFTDELSLRQLAEISIENR